MPNSPVNCKILHTPDKITLVDLHFDTPAPIDLLIRAFWKLRSNDIGNRSSYTSKIKIRMFYFYLNNLESQITMFSELEDYRKIRFLSDEENSCQEHFKNTVTRHIDRRFIVRTPFKLFHRLLGEFISTARKRFCNLDQKF